MTIPIQTINLGSYPNDGTGDDLRTAFTKVNDNFKTLFLGGAIVNGTNLGTGTSIFVGKNTSNLNLEFRTLISDSSMVIAHDGNTVQLAAITKLQRDTLPTLGNNLNLNGYFTYGGDTRNTVYGLDVPVLTNLVSTVLSSNQLNLDLGTLTQPTGYQRYTKGYPIDLNGTGVLNGFNNLLANDYDFGELDVSNVLTVGTKKLTLNSNLTTNGASISLQATSNSSVTLPNRGTLAVIDLGLAQFSGTSSSQLKSVITDSTGTGPLVFNTNPTLTGTVTALNVSASGYVYVTGNFAVNGNKFEVDAATGNTLVAGDLTVTGNLINATRPSTYITIAKLPGNQLFSGGSDHAIELLKTDDASNWWNNANHYFKPNIAGYYNISYTVLWVIGSGVGQINVQIYKNSSSVAINQNQINTTQNLTMSTSLPVYLNGTTDYVFLTGYTSSGAGQTIEAGNGTIFSAFLISR
jgi:hypothetical protein